MEHYSIHFSPLARASLKEIYSFVAENSSIESADLLRDSLLMHVEGLGVFPRRFPREKYLAHLGGEIRSFSKWKIKIVYEVIGQTVLVVNFYHSRRDPDKMLD